MKYMVFSLLALMLGLLTVSVHARAAVSTPLDVAVENAVRAAVVSSGNRAAVSVFWKHTPFLVRSLRFRPGKKIKVAREAKEDITRCQAVLVPQKKLGLVPTACLQRKNDSENSFELKRIVLDFANGNRFVFLPSQMQPRGEWTYLEVPEVLLRGIGAAA